MSSIWTPICDRLGVALPIFGFAHDIKTVAAITNAGGYGVYGATRRFPDEITAELAEIRPTTAGDLTELADVNARVWKRLIGAYLKTMALLF